MRATLAPTTVLSPLHSNFPKLTPLITTVNRSRRHTYPNALKCLDHKKVCPEDHYQRNATKYWDNFYKRHQDKFFKDRHYLEKDWRCYFAEDEVYSNEKVVLEVGCGSGSTLFPLMAAFPNLYVHACDLSPHAIELVKSNANFIEDRVNAIVCDVTLEDLCEKIDPFSVDVVTLVFMLSAVSPSKMPLILENIKTVTKPNGYVLLRDYAAGDFAQVKLQKKDRMIGEDFYVRGDGTCSFYFSEDFLSSLFLRAGFHTVDMNTYCREVYNRSRNVTMNRRWIRAVFKSV
ncbi:tRNA N(3)-methylcytidine methyltransferase trm141-like [Humulus lupulus]|uniref:tRNA N(3)-methylcytidine methyltransferase trm141-like n=1 Tax=Humulus lupulus TaxID=3486 RepID=UPI002B417F8D|nr:tRNA N(3)-methylcytidine methyltransferase trm141-like [Humulus lupulus]